MSHTLVLPLPVVPSFSSQHVGLGFLLKLGEYLLSVPHEYLRIGAFTTVHICHLQIRNLAPELL